MGTNACHDCLQQNKKEEYRFSHIEKRSFDGYQNLYEDKTYIVFSQSVFEA